MKGDTDLELIRFCRPKVKGQGHKARVLAIPLERTEIERSDWCHFVAFKVKHQGY